MQNPLIVGDRVYLRPLDVEDTDIFVSWINDAEIRQYLGVTSPVNRLQQQEYLAIYENERNLGLGIMLKANDELIGSVGLHDILLTHRNAEIGIFIGNKSYWSKGYGTETLKLMMGHGFDQLNLHRIFLKVKSFNTRAIRAYEKVGFKKEAVFREHVYANGKYHGDYLMGILEDEWRNRGQI